MTEAKNADSMRRMFASPAAASLTSVVLVSVIPFIGIGFFALSQTFVRKVLLLLVSFSTGVLLGDVFFHIFPEMTEVEGAFEAAVPYILLGILVSFCIEKFIHWHHCHVMPSKTHYHPVGAMSLFGDVIHNFVDGTLIAGSFLVSTQVGIATTLAVVLHEIPQEIGDYALLLYSGFSRAKALLFNVFAQSSAILGVIAVIVLSQSVSGVSEILLAFAAGNFIYLAGTDLIPELHKDTHPGRAALQLVLIVAGLGVMYALTMVE